jgi:APA family basic amino acid/polyamine antiporter
VPRALLWGTLITIGVYVGLNTLYVYAVPVPSLQGEVRIGELTAQTLLGHNAGWMIAVVIAFSIAGVLNAMVITGPRVYFSMARHGVFFARAARLHPRFHTPGDALLLQAAWTSLLLLSGTFEQLLTYTTVVLVGFSVVTVSAVFLLRRRHPELLRPYQTWGYPWLPVLYMLGSLGIVLNAFVEQPVEGLWGIGLCAAGIPAYWWWRRVDTLSPAA